MAKARIKVERFDRINRSQLRMKETSKRTRTGAFKRGRTRAHSRHYKH